MKKKRRTIKTFHQYEINRNEHTKAIVNVPNALNKLLSQSLINDIKQQCLLEYGEAKIAMEQSITDLAVHDEGALNFAKELSQKVLLIMEIAIELNLIDKKEAPIYHDVLEKLGVSKDAMLARSPDLLDELKKKIGKAKIIVEEGSVHESGFTGFNPLAIEKATTGNLRERMYIPYKTTHGFTKNLFSNKINVDAINLILKHREVGWQLNAQIIDVLRDQTKDKNDALYAYGTYASSREGSRRYKSKTSQEEYLKKNPRIKEMTSMRAPLSPRELLAQTGDLKPDLEKNIQWLPGEAYSSVDDSVNHPTVRLSKETGDLMLTGISGTTDSILTLAYMLGMFDDTHQDEKMKNAILSLIGWMVDARDHSMHEILTSAKTFGVLYHPGPDAYKQIRPGDNNSLSALQTLQHARGFKMPDEYLSAAHVIELAQEKLKEQLNLNFIDLTDSKDSNKDKFENYKNRYQLNRNEDKKSDGDMNDELDQELKKPSV